MPTAIPLKLPDASHGPASPTHGFAITPNDTNPLANVTRYIFVGTEGNLSVILEDDSTEVTFVAILAGLYPLAIKQVLATGTTATDLIGLY